MQLLPVTKNLVSIVHGWLAAPENGKWLDFGDVETLSLLSFQAMLGRKHDVYRVFTPDDSEEPIGVVALTGVHLRTKNAFLWMVLGNKTYAKRGYTARALSEILGYGFNVLNLESVYAWAAETNYPCIRISEILGFRCIGRQRRCHLIDGVLQDRLLYDLVRAEYKPLNPLVQMAGTG
jgi:RimJ/RimL family protein N-acetyltransferase